MNWRTYLAVAAMLAGISAILASVGGPAAVASYHHAYEVFKRFGEEESRAAWLPLTTDGMLAAALVVMYSRRWAGQRVGGIPWLAFVVGFSGTLAANLASAKAFEPGIEIGESIGRLSAAVWAPISFAVTLELVAVMLGRVRDYIARKRAAVDTTWPVTHYVGIPVYPYVPVVPEPTRDDRDAALDVLTGALLAAGPPPATPRRVVPQVAPSRPARRRPARPAASRQDDPARPAGTTRVGERDDPAVIEWIGSEWDRDGRAPTVKAVRAYVPCGGTKAGRLLDAARATRPAVRPVPAAADPERDEQDAEAAS